MESYITILFGDIGATNCRLFLKRISRENHNTRELIKEHTFPSKEYSSLEEIIKLFLHGIKTDDENYPSIMTLALVGVRAGDEVFVSNLDHWPKVNVVSLPLNLSIPISQFLNDFEANGYGVLQMNESQYEKINDITVQENAVKAVMGPGTGLGESIIAKGSNSSYYVIPTEGGYSDFAPKTDIDWRLLKYLQKKCSSLSIPIERVCSGPGIQAIYEFLIQENEDLEEEILKQEDISPELIVQEALKGKPLPKKALDIFIAALGSECSNLACKSLCYGGLYIVGSLVTAIKEYIQSSTIFWEFFYEKERLESYMRKIPIFIVKKDVGANGAENVAISLIR